MSPWRCMAVIAVLLRGGYAGAADETMDWLLGQAKEGPATRPAEPATRPATPTEKANPEARAGVVTLSSGKRLPGAISTTREKPLRIWDAGEKAYRDVPLALVRSIEAKVVWERDEKEWHFKASGSDVKEFTGKTYPARELEYRVTLVNGQKVSGGVVAPIYVAERGERRMFALYKRQKGEVGMSLRELLYIQRIELE